MNKYHLQITTWTGISIGATHFYGCIYGEFKPVVKKFKTDLDFDREKYDVERDTEDSEGFKSRFLSREEVIKAAIKTFKRLKLKGIFYLGDAAIAQPQRVLLAPKALIHLARKENELWKKQRKLYDLGGYDTHEREMEKINQQWEKLWKRAKNRKIGNK